MTVKLIGALFIAISSFALSSHFCSCLSREKDELGGFISLLNHIRLEISCFSKPLSQIFSEFSCPALDKSGFTETLRERGFSEGLKKNACRLNLSKEVKDVLLSFSQSLGHGYREDEIKRCDNTISCLEERYKACLDTLPEKRKLIKSLSITFGISVIVILI